MIKTLLLFLVFVLSPISLFLLGMWDTANKVFLVNFSVWPDVLNNDFYFSFYVTFISTLLSCLLGSVLAFSTILKFQTSRSFKLFNFIIFIPHLAFAYLVYLFFSPTGFLSRALSPILDLSDFFVVNDQFGFGIIIHYVLKELIFVFLFFMSSHTSFDREVVKSSYSLGASKIETFFKIYLPLKKKTLLAVSIIIFAYCLGSYEAPYLLGANSPKMIAVSVYENFQSIDSTQNELSYIQTFVIFVTTAFFSLLSYTFLRRKK